MQILEYQLRFLTPAFLGNAEQQGQWRTPPIKALLRQWWRVAYSAERSHKVDVATMRKVEAGLFGVAADGKEESQKSAVRIRLDRWAKGGLKQWRRLDTVYHPETGKNHKGSDVGSDLYLGYGPIDQSVQLKSPPAIDAGDSAVLRVAVPIREGSDVIPRALALMHRFATLGGRSRNGWGSFELNPVGPTPPILSDKDVLPLRDWKEALQLDWPHALGRDTRPLIWQTKGMSDWRAVMKRLAELKIGLRTLPPFSLRGEVTPHRHPLPRHWLSYPIGKEHKVTSWGDVRLPNSLRFKVRDSEGTEGSLCGTIVHVPCSPPQKFRPDSKEIVKVWQAVHAYLDDAAQQLDRVSS